MLVRVMVTIPDGDNRAGADCVVVILDGHGVPARLHVDKMHYFLESAD